MLANVSDTAIDISGNLEWFDLLDETLQSFLVVPLYYILRTAIEDGKNAKNIFSELTVVAIIIYFAITIAAIYNISKISKAMSMYDFVFEAEKFLRLKAISYLPGILFAILNVLIIILGKPIHIWIMAILKMCSTVFFDIIFIDLSGVNGTAYTDFVVNFILILFLIIILKKENMLIIRPKLPEKTNLIIYIKLGIFSGASVLLANIMYSQIVCKMVNAVSEQGNYWVANNIIYGLFLAPVFAISEMIKRNTVFNIKKIFTAVCGIWLISIPFWKIIIQNILGITDYQPITNILFILMPFYIFYFAYTVLEAKCINMGNTRWPFFANLITNLCYYPICYIFFLKGIWTPNITTICLLFGGGMLCCFLVLASLYKIKQKA